MAWRAGQLAWSCAWHAKRVIGANGASWTAHLETRVVELGMAAVSQACWGAWFILRPPPAVSSASRSA